MLPVGDDATPSARLWAQGRPHALRSLFHPFVAGLAAGSLPREGFRAFLLQDAYYLTGFAKVRRGLNDRPLGWELTFCRPTRSRSPRRGTRAT